MHKTLDIFYYIEKLKIACTSINFYRLINKEIKQHSLDFILDQIEEYDLTNEVPLLAIYYNSYKMLVNKNEKFFKSLKSVISENTFPKNEVKDAYLLAINFCIQQLNIGNSEYDRQIFELYKTGLDKTYLLVNDNIPPITYSNIVTIGLRLKRYSEVKEFIEKYKRIISGTNKPSYYYFNLSKLYFEQENYDKVIELYHNSDVDELLLKIQVRIIQLKAFFELNEIDLCYSNLQNLDQLLNRKDVLAYHKKVFKNNAKMFRQLLSVNEYNKKEIKKLMGKMDKVNPLTEKPWFLEKLNDLI